MSRPGNAEYPRLHATPWAVLLLKSGGADCPDAHCPTLGSAAYPSCLRLDALTWAVLGALTWAELDVPPG